MSTMMSITRTLSRARCLVRLAAIMVAALVIGMPAWSIADESEARTFPSAADATEALFQAVQNGDENAVVAILGARDNLASCGDASQDGRERQRFVEKYQEMHRLVREPDGSTVLYIGAENWPFPIPVVSSRGRWHFDAEAGGREVMFRRIGADEATAIEVCRAAVQAARHNQTAPSSTDPIVNFATDLVSAARANPGARSTVTDERPFHGYRFAAVKNGGITVIAYPTDYRSSGVMTFVVGEDGVVYERDLGPDTARVARHLKARPASGWRAVG
jgi:hypothetical protein